MGLSYTMVGERSRRDLERAFDRGEEWLQGWKNCREGGYETLILDGDGSSLSVLLMGEDGSIHRLRWEGPLVSSRRTVPQPSAVGIGETLAAEICLVGRWPELGWEVRKPSAVRGKGLFMYPLGPVRADVAESVAYRLTVMGDEIVHLALGSHFKPRHIRALVKGRTIADALPLVARFTTTSNVHHALAFALAVEDAWNYTPPDAVQTTRTLLAELERAYSHLGDLALLAVSTGLPVPQMEYLHLKEVLLRLNYQLFGHRYLRGTVVPGGLDQRLWPAQVDTMAALRVVSQVRDDANDIASGLQSTSSFLDRLHGAGRIPARALSTLRPVGPVGRASGRPGDVRRVRPYTAYHSPQVFLPVFMEQQGDAYARFRLRVDELDAGLNVVRRILGGSAERIPFGHDDVPPELGTPDRTSGVGVVEAPRGLLVYDLRLDADTGRIAHLGVATPSQRNWMVVPDAMANGNILQDFPIIDASFALSVAGWDG